jgi:hypothetical protein
MWDRTRATRWDRASEPVWAAPVSDYDEPTTIGQVCFVRDGGACFRCGMTDAYEWNCHHRQLKGGGGADTLENRILLDGSGASGCHGHVHHNRAEAFSEGWIVSRYEDPARVPALHYRLGKVFLTAEGEVIPEDTVVAWDLTGNRPLTELVLAVNLLGAVDG